MSKNKDDAPHELESQFILRLPPEYAATVRRAVQSGHVNLFGPTPVMGTQDTRRCPGRSSKQTPWPAKSWSLNTEEVPDFERSFFNRNPSEEKLRYPNSGSQTPNFSGPDRHPVYLVPKDQQKVLPAGYAVKPNGLKSKEISSPVDLEKHEAVKKFKDKSISCTSGQHSSDTSSVGTQTEQHVLDPPKCKDLCTSGQAKYGDRHAMKQSDDDSEIVSDDISDIFRFHSVDLPSVPYRLEP